MRSRCSPIGSPADRKTARLKVECGATGMISRPSAPGETIGPPAEKLYAVDPVGVATTMASAAYRTKGCSATHTSTAATGCPGCRTSATSLKAKEVPPPKSTCAATRVSTVKRPASTAASASGRSGTSTSARKPSRPRLTPSTGTPAGWDSRNARSMVPSPPRLTSRSHLGSSPASMACTPPPIRATSSGRPSTSAPCPPAQARIISIASAESRRGCSTNPIRFGPCTGPA